MRVRHIMMLATVAFFVATTGFGQFSQYTQPGNVTTGSEVTREGFEGATEDARWRLGPVYVDPWFGVREVALVDNALGAAEGEEDSDVTATAGAGLRTFLRTSPKVYWTVHALPEYVWWRDSADRRRVNGGYGAGVFGFFNRLTLEASAQRDEIQQVATSELVLRINQRVDTVVVAAEVDLSRSIAVFGRYESDRYRYLLNGDERQRFPIFGVFDRDEDALQAGLRFQLGSKLKIGLGLEQSEAKFLSAEQNQSNTATSPLFDLDYQGSAVQVAIRGARRSLTPEPGSELRETDVTTGRLTVNFDRGGRLGGSIYFERQLNLSISPDYSFYTGETAGLSVSYQLGSRTRLRTFVEDGDLDFERSRDSAPARIDAFSAFGGEISYDLGRSLALKVAFSSITIDSDVPGQDRSQSAIGVRIAFGSSGGGWY